jgi:ribonuclease HII
MNPCGSSFCVPAASSLPDTFFFERALYQQGMQCVAGVDEAGRGPLAGPVIAACVVLPKDCTFHIFRDSKKLTARQREHLFADLQSNGARIGVGLADPREIEELNILQASLLAMQRAVTACAETDKNCSPDYLLVDGTFQVPIAMQQTTLVKGESKSASIAAASIIAKVTRDRLMTEAHRCFPQYGFHRHQGYPTREHRDAIRLHGTCPLHRRTFRGVAEFVLSTSPDPPPGQRELW